MDENKIKKQNQEIKKIKTQDNQEKKIPQYVSDYPTHLLVDFLHR